MDFGVSYPSRRVPLLAANVVATSQPLAAQAGLSMLASGGNAIDAALAAAITLSVVEPTGNGIGSDAFAIVWDGAELHGLNASGRSPASWTPERFAGATEMPQRGWESVTVPGAVSAWVALSERFGALPFEALFAPALNYAQNGFAVSPTIAALWQAGGRTLSGQPGFAAHFLPEGRAPRAGERFVNPDLARTLEAIASTKGLAFYEGELAEAIAEDAARHGAALTREDLAAHRCDWCGTISTAFHGVDLHEIPPNGQGIAALIALGLLRGTDIADHAPDSVEAMHLQIEAVKLALADAERYVADPAAMEVGPGALLDDAYLAERARLIGAEAGDPGAGAPRDGGTVYLSAADAEGRMVSFIQSNYAGFGSGVVVPRTGIHLQNRGAGFDLAPDHPNVVGPSKRPFHTIIPGFVMRDGRPEMSFGVMGGPMQAQGHVQMVVRTALHGQNPQAASDAPRWRVVACRKVAVEWGMPTEIVEGLAARGHEITREAPDNAFGFGGAQLVMRGEAGYVAGSDHRKDGCAVGF
ncbi:gamma-glutamyltranspeptidase/glutathione hydrolase [Palleronia aestuarii]|uniref:Gamma-glutamyltranspeptidase/glutathione hydrolase n=1 Tax=Palleronia aestuarii TaxID=568105 RepID=A0A2W7N475_9RHOB|nr:gamma-glutamyltransferase family protein [Palleronia aestuarii]PZX14890.1 gamma-glutamyltranspeptidase/glutathione hydrolase [Palleronia aestuarii]